MYSTGRPNPLHHGGWGSRFLARVEEADATGFPKPPPPPAPRSFL